MPPDDCGGAWAYLDLRQHHSVFAIAERLQDILDAGTLDDDQEEVRALLRWLTVEHFDRRRVNCRLRQYAAGDDRWRSDA